jgi:hypothetical protein
MIIAMASPRSTTSTSYSTRCTGMKVSDEIAHAMVDGVAACWRRRFRNRAEKEIQITRARCKAPYHIHAPTTIQRKGHGLMVIRVGKTRERFFSKFIVFPDISTFEKALLGLYEGWHV